MALLFAASAAFVSAQEKKAESTQTTPPPAVFSWGGDVRLRNEYFNNGLTLDDTANLHEQDYFRTRMRLWSVYTPVQDLVFNLRVAAEPRTWMRQPYVKQQKGDGTEWRYVIIDSLSLKYTTSVADMPLAITIGRQDIQFGDTNNAWLVYDGSPAEGSWTLFFDAVRASLNVKSIKTQFDAIFLNQQAHPTDHLTILGAPSTYTMAEQDEKGVILNAANTSIENTKIEGYFIYKNDTPVLPTGYDGEIYTLGSRISGTPSAHWSYAADVAYQWGKKLDRTVKVPVAVTTAREIDAYGANARLTYLFKDKLNNQVSAIFEYLSGDKPGTTNKDETFDILWGRYPRWSEVGANTFAIETGGRNAQYNNLIRLGTNWTVSPMKDMTVSTSYNALFAPEVTPTHATNIALFSQSGHFRGNYFQSYMRYYFTKQMSGLLFGELYFQGNYYAHRETMSFVRGEIMYTF